MSLAKGDSIPDIALKDQNGKTVNLRTYLDGRIGVVFFYPKDGSPGCTDEVCSFRDFHEQFLEAGAKILGISPDSVESHTEFSNVHDLPYPLLSDEDKTARKAFGVPGFLFGLISGRVTYIFNQDGKLVHSFRSQFRASRHTKEAMNVVQSLIEAAD